MSFATNSSQQVSLFDVTSNLTDREKKMLNKSWARYFAENIFPAIDEQPFQVLYSNRPSRHNTPVNVMIGALILKELFNLTDEEMVETLPFDIRFQYALHTTSFNEQPLNDRSLGRFRARCNVYEESTGIDLIYHCITSLSAEVAQMMHLNSSMRRMDSLMVASNIKKMSRLELFYTCVANLCKLMAKREDSNLPKSLQHYLEDGDHNTVLYHNRSEDTASKTDQVLADATILKNACNDEYDQTSEYQLLIRVMSEQTTIDHNGSLVLKKASSDMNASILQNPADSDATYRKKAGKEYQGYIANVVELADDKASIVVDYQFEQNTYSDSQFLKDYINRQPEENESATLVTDGGYCGNDNAKMANGKNIRLVTTDLKGKAVSDIWADFKFSEDGTELIKCAGGYSPKSSVYDKNTEKCKASFPIQVCQNCPCFEQCKPILHKRVATVNVAQRTAYHAEQQRFIGTDEYKELSHYRNGVETVPAALRKRHHIDKMPVKGKIKCGLYFGFKVAAINVRKLVKYMSSLDTCTPKPQISCMI
ncbi:transposase [Muricomes intestini]|uniref:transposase n=1 Tax=Muricomes intestini TaxID=1796634 RepID=UPI002FE0E989